MLYYIDPGTGSMLFTILIGAAGAGLYAVRNLAMKLRFRLSGGRQDAQARAETEIAIFSDDKRYWNVFAPICRELDRRGQRAVYLTASPDDPALEETFEHVQCEFLGEGNRAFAALNNLRSEIVLSTTPGLDVYQWKRSRYVKWYVHIPHAASDIAMYRMFGIDYYDAILLSGDYQLRQVRELERLRGLPPKELELVGLTYLDVMRERLRAAPDAPTHPTTVLLAPSWGKSAILSRYGARMLQALLDTGYHIVVRPHPQSFKSETALLEGLMAAFPASEQLEWNRDNDNFAVLQRSDILISDFSGVIFDYALIFDKPVMYADTSYDRGPYDAWWLKEEPLWTFETLPRIGMPLTEERLGALKTAIDACMHETRYQQGRDDARAQTWAHMGEGTERTVDYLQQKLRELNAPADAAAPAPASAP